MITGIGSRGRVLNYVPKKVLIKSFFKNKKFGDFYYKRQTEDFVLNKKAISFRDKHFDNFINKVEKITYSEDIEKTVNFLDNTEFLQLVSVYPYNDDVIDISHSDIRYGIDGDLELKTSTKRIQCGKIETVDFETILSKEILNRFVRYGKMTANASKILKDFKGYKNDIFYGGKTALEVLDYIMKYKDSFLEYQNYDIIPNTLILPIDICELLFVDIPKYSHVLQKLNRNICGLNVWSNPHTDDIIFFENEYKEDEIFNGDVAKNTLLFTPHILFAKYINEDINSGFYNPNKYQHSYTLTDIGFSYSNNFFTLYK